MLLAGNKQCEKAPPRRGVAGGPLCPSPTAAPDQSGVCGAVSRPTHRRPLGWEGHVEHVVSGKMTHFDSLEELLVFLARVLSAVETP